MLAVFPGGSGRQEENYEPLHFLKRYIFIFQKQILFII